MTGGALAYSFGYLCGAGVDTTVNAIQKAGSEPATAAEIRASLAEYKMPAASPTRQ